MKKLNIVLLFVSALVMSASANAIDKNIFSGKSSRQHKLTDWEQKKMVAEFNSKFNMRKSATSKNLNSNPWKEKQNNSAQNNSQQLTNNWGSCREYAYGQRTLCYSRGGDAYTCERYYDARVAVCNDKF
ncbi:MAG: hypothetical protein ACN4GM_06295 [Gammaproteobacteria bacterium]